MLLKINFLLYEREKDYGTGISKEQQAFDG
jgi:hypothetical protein